MTKLSQENAVKERYSRGAQKREEALCCPTQYNPKLLEPIPQEVLERDYGCGDPSRYVETGETVLDLGSGTGKICFILSQIVGPTGQVIGIDMNDDMLALARSNAPIVAERIGHANVDFRRGRIQAMQTIIEDASIDVIVSNCVLNLVDNDQKQQLFREIYRVLRPHGRAIISDIVASKEVPQAMQADPELWSGCISGALSEEMFPQAFITAGFHSTTILERQADAWRVVQGIEFRSITVGAYKTVTARKQANQASSSSHSCCA